VSRKVECAARWDELKLLRWLKNRYLHSYATSQQPTSLRPFVKMTSSS
jgi:hypothetical protein